jgi:hypothetical protein
MCQPAGGEEPVEAGKQELLAKWFGNTGSLKTAVAGGCPSGSGGAHGSYQGRTSQIEQGKISGQDVLARYAIALGGRLHQSIYFDDGDIAAIA